MWIRTSTHAPKNAMLATVQGTLQYMSPEMLNHEDYNFQSDIFSVGVIFYVMLFQSFLHKRLNNGQVNDVGLYRYYKRGKIIKRTIKRISKCSIEFLKGCLQFNTMRRFSFVKNSIYNSPLMLQPYHAIARPYIRVGKIVTLKINRNIAF